MGISIKGKQGFQSSHGMTGHPLYKSWKRIKNRCYNKNSDDYKDYGGRGIVMCDEWKDDFVEFMYWALKHGWRQDLTIERKDVNGNYSPNNCTWIPMKEQAKNKRNVRLITYKEETHNLAEWARIIGMSRHTLASRLTSKNYTLEEAFETPVNSVLRRK